MTDREPCDLIVRGDIVLESGVLHDGYLAVHDERIASIGLGALAPRGREEVDYQDMLIFPGVVDTHVHTLSDPAEGIATATASAAAGGVTTIVDMPYDVPEAIYSEGLFRRKIEQVETEARVDVGLYATIRKSGGVAQIPALIAAGAPGFKFSLFETDPMRFPRISDGDLLAAFEILANTDLPAVVHAELGEIIDEYSGRLTLDDEGNPLSHGKSRPPVSETAAEVKALELAYWSGVRLHLAHVTHPRGFLLIDWYRAQGARVSGETCVHYLALSEEDVTRIGPRAKVNPPIRNRESQEGLWGLLRRGLIASISSDHAPWTWEKKDRSMMAASSGAPGLATLLPVMYTIATKRGFAPQDVARFICADPAAIYGLGGRKGTLRVDSDADFVAFDPHTQSVFSPERAYSSAKWSPFEGMTLSGSVVATYVRGHVVFEDGRVVAEPGSGQWLGPGPRGAREKVRAEGEFQAGTYRSP